MDSIDTVCVTKHITSEYHIPQGKEVRARHVVSVLCDRVLDGPNPLPRSGPTLPQLDSPVCRVRCILAVKIEEDARETKLFRLFQILFRCRDETTACVGLF